MPVDVAVEQPCTRVISPPSDSGTSSRRNGHGIPSNRVYLVLVDRRVEFGIVRGVIHSLIDDLEVVAVQVERVETGVAGGDEHERHPDARLVKDLRVDKGELDNVQVLDSDRIAHGTVDSLERGICTHAERREQAWHLGHLVCTRGPR